MKANFGSQLGIFSSGQFMKEFTDGSDHTRLLNADGRVAEARSLLQWINSVAVYDAVDVNVADVVFFGQPFLELLEGGVKQLIGSSPEHHGTHFTGRRTQIAGEMLFYAQS